MGKNILLVTFLTVVLLIVFLNVLIKSGNKRTIRVLKRLGIDVYIDDINLYYSVLSSINKDVVGVIKIEGVCISPIMRGNYSKKDINKKECNIGELYIMSNKLSQSFLSLSRSSNNVNTLLKDFTVIKGSNRSKNKTPMGFKLACMKGYVSSLKSNYSPKFEVIEGGKIRNFRVISGVDILIEDMVSLSCRSRGELISLLRSKAYYNFNIDSIENRDIIFLMSSTDIDMHLVILAEF